MSTLETMHGLLHDEKHRTFRQRFEVIIVLFVLSGSWITAGYMLAMRVTNDRVEALQVKHQKDLDAKSEKYRKDLDALATQACKKEALK